MVKWWRVLLRWRHYPVLILPMQRGPLHGFYHFFVGYFIPLYKMAKDSPQKEIAAVDSTPLNSWFELIPAKSLKIVPRDEAIKIAYLSRLTGYARGYRVSGDYGWDKPELFSRRNFSKIQQWFASDFEEASRSMLIHKPKIIVLGRDFTPDYYAQFLPTRYGTAKRNIPNIKELVLTLEPRWDIELIDPATMSPLEVVAKCRNAEVLIGQHGAALTNLFFLPRGSHVIEIAWSKISDPNTLNMYRILCEELGLSWSRPLLQSDEFSAVDPAELEKILVSLELSKST